jgi:SAM-dependent methyltransferase
MQQPLNDHYWNNRYLESNTGWDLGKVSPPLRFYIDQLSNKQQRILIPGCGNAYEAQYLVDQGFSSITLVDFAPTLVANLQNEFNILEQNPVKVICEDFFNLQGTFDLILEQTFFCALDPGLRKEYVLKMHELLADGGRLAGVLFNREFETGPPFGGNEEEYVKLFEPWFDILKMEVCQHSIQPRMGTELFFELKKKSVLK